MLKLYADGAFRPRYKFTHMTHISLKTYIS